MNQRLQKSIGSAFIGALLLLFSCNLDEFQGNKDVVYEPIKTHLGLPIGSPTEWSMVELAEELKGENDTSQLQVVTDEGIVKLTYTQETVFDAGEEFVDVEAREERFIIDIFKDARQNPAFENNSVNLGPARTFGDTSSQWSKFEAANEEGDGGGERIDSLIYKDGAEVTVTITNTTGLDLSFKYLFSTLYQNDNRIGDSVFISSNGSNSVSNTFDLTSSAFQNMFPDSTISAPYPNWFETQYWVVATLDSLGTYDSEGKITFSIAINNPSIETIFGDFLLDSVNFDAHTIKMDGFERFSLTGFKVGNPSLRLDATNSFGINVDFFLNGLTAIRGFDSVALEHINPDDSLFFPIRPPEDITEGFFSTDLNIGSDSTNFDSLVNLIPLYFQLPVRGIGNRDKLGQQVELYENFVTDTSKVIVTATLDIPLEINMSDFQYEDDSLDFDFNPESIEQADTTDSITIFITAENNLPLNVGLDLLMIDSSGVAIDSVRKSSSGFNFLISSPQIDSNGEVIGEPVKATRGLTIGGQKINSLKKTDKLKIRLRMRTNCPGDDPTLPLDDSNNCFSGDQPVFAKFRSDYKIEVSMSIEVRAKIDINTF